MLNVSGVLSTNLEHYPSLNGTEDNVEMFQQHSNTILSLIFLPSAIVCIVSSLTAIWIAVDNRSGDNSLYGTGKG